MHYQKKISRHVLEQKRLDFALRVKSIGENGVFAGYASVFNVVDNQRDVIARGAFAQTLKGRVSEIKLLWQHQMGEPIGVFTTIFEDARGLYVEGRLLLDVARAKEAHALLKAGALSGLSIGYSPIRYHVDPDSGVRHIKEVELWEISLVTFPANASANVTVVKGEQINYSPLEGESMSGANRWGVYDKAILPPTASASASASPLQLPLKGGVGYILSPSRGEGDDWKSARSNGQLMKLQDALDRAISTLLT